MRYVEAITAWLVLALMIAFGVVFGVILLNVFVDVACGALK